jgi:hypothetical protein
VLLAKGKATKGTGEARVIRAIARAFEAAYGREPAISVVSPSGGVRREAVR